MVKVPSGDQRQERLTGGKRPWRVGKIQGHEEHTPGLLGPQSPGQNAHPTLMGAGGRVDALEAGGRVRRQSSGLATESLHLGRTLPQPLQEEPPDHTEPLALAEAESIHCLSKLNKDHPS